MTRTLQAPPRGDDAPDELLRQACALLRLCGQDALVAGVLLALVLVGVVAQIAASGWPGPVGFGLLLALGCAFSMSAGFVVRSRRTLVAALSTARGNTGSPLDPGVPWKPFGMGATLDSRVRDGELRRLLAAAHRCSELSWRAVVWGVATAVTFIFWTMAMVTL